MVQIDDRRSVNTDNFRDVEYGEAFEYNSEIFIKCCVIDGGEDCYGMNIANGSLCLFAPDDEVIPIPKLTFILENR